jgi:hypothetical protein
MDENNDTRFKPGQSGNPAGRPKGSKNQGKILKRLLEERVTVKMGRKSMRLTRAEVMIRATFRKAAQGEARAAKNLTQWAEYCGLLTAEPEAKSWGRGNVITMSEYQAYLKEMAAERDNEWQD